MTALPFDSRVSGPATGLGHFTPTADGNILVFLWGGGGGGAGGISASRGGPGGGGGALSLSVIPVLAGVTYDFVIGGGGVGGAQGGGAGADGEDTYWGSSRATARYVAEHGYGAPGGGLTPGAGGGDAGSLGDTIQPGQAGTPAAANVYSGQRGGDAGGADGGDGGTATGGGGQGAGGDGLVPGGGGSGGGQTFAGDGGDGAPGGVYIIEAPDTKFGYYHIGINDDGVYDGAGTYNFTPKATGQVCVELYGSGAGGTSGVFVGATGRSGGGGGAYAKKILTVYQGVTYTYVVPAGGTGGTGNGQAGTDGADATFTLATKNVATKARIGGVGILTFTTPHGYNPGDSAIVAGVDANHNGTHTVTSISPDRLTMRYALAGADIAAAAATGTVAPNFMLVKAKGGLKASASAGIGTGGLGGLASGCIGDVTHDGDDGEDSWGAQVGGVQGTNGGAGALPNGGLGGWGGKHNEDDNTISVGQPGITPGGGGGGGAGSSGSVVGGAGAPGGAIISFILTLGLIAEDGVARPVLQIIWKDNSGVTHNISEVILAHGGVPYDQRTLILDPDAGLRKVPSWVPALYVDRFDLDTGRFNWDVGGQNIDAAIAAGDFHWGHIGDSVSDGSYFLDRSNPLNFNLNYPTAYPRQTRDFLGAASGTGLVRVANIATPDPQWVRGSWATKTHYLESTNTSHVATFTPVIAGTDVRVVTMGVGTVNVTIDNVLVGQVVGGANAAAVQSNTWHLAGPAAAHVVKVSPAVGGVTTWLLGADCFTPGPGYKVHNLAQGGSRATLAGEASPQQKVWGDITAAAPTNMTNIYKNMACYDRRPNAFVLALGGNDAFQLVAGSVIATDMGEIGDAFDHADTDIVLFPDTHNVDQITAMYNLAISKNWALIDFFYLTRNLRSIFGQDYNGDTYGHPNYTRTDGGTPGMTWLGNMLKVGLKGS